jgi:2-(1,2-epoxy-1,2-dihydrophenyl)acetyl-CoA isomerase
MPRLKNSQLNQPEVLFEFRDSIAFITLDRPASLNTLTATLARELLDLLTKLHEGPRAMIITGAGRAFSAGGDMHDMQAIASREGKPEAFFDAPLRSLHECVLLIRRAPYPVIAAVNGVASGAGCNLALSCDIVIAAETARFNQAFVRIGLAPDCGGTFLLPRLLGPKRAAELSMTGDFVDAKQAAEMGMINRVVPDRELMNVALGVARQLASGPARSLKAIKELLNTSAANSYEAQLHLERAAQLKLGLTRDFQEGLAAFLAKRPPQFTGQ